MSFGEPNSPYGQPQGQPQGPAQGQQPGYGYPAGPPQGPAQGQPGYGYPQAPPVQAYNGGYPGANTMTEMPGGVKAARVMLWIMSGLCLIGGLIFIVAGVAINGAKDHTSDSQLTSLMDKSTSMVIGIAVLALVWCVLLAVLAVKVKNGGNGLRVTLIVVGVLTAILALYPFTVLGIVHLVLSILVIVFVAKSDGAAWFNRRRA
ncbi:hypothetical protein [Streptomyces montanisoli]|uniref:Uncharacterized protein n=1 Tax=Streptomyces montanisoli TaxID=2798581 RepID=A0A940MJV8_9ACTN|nr:hypothetical protein [Streptomyces montanisoli]MBP0461082.1 hypothetical protein [Streptomyces montanisoli]